MLNPKGSDFHQRLLNTTSLNVTRSIRRRAFLGYGALGLGLSLFNNSCSYRNEEKPLRIGINDWIGYQIIQAAQALGYFRQRQVEIDLIYFNNLQDATRAMYRGVLDATFTTIWDLLEPNPERKQVAPLILLVSDVSAGADGIVARSPLATIKELSGKKVGVKLGTVNHLILLEALAFHNIAPANIMMENLPNETAAQQLQAGKLDAAVIWQPLLGEIAQKIGGNIVYNTSQTNSLVIDILATSDATMRQKSSQFQRLLWVWFDLMNQLGTNAQSIFQALAVITGRSAVELQQDYRGVKPGNLALNQHFLGQKNQLSLAIADIIQLIQADPHHPKAVVSDIQIDRQFIQTALNSWSAQP